MWIGWSRWWRAALLTALAIVGIVVAGSWMFLRVWGPALTREHVETLLSDALGQPVHVGGVHLEPWRLRASVTDLDVPAAPASPAGIRLRAATVDVDVDIASVWRREIVLSGVASDLDLEMTMPASETPAPRIFPLPESFRLGPIRIGIGKVRVSNGHAVIRHVEPALTVEVTRADLTARPITGDLDISGRLETVRVDASGRHEQLDRVALEGRLSADLARIRRIGWRWQGEPMEVEGEVRQPWDDARELSLRANGDVSLAAVARASNVDLQLAGKARVAAELAGPIAAAQVRGQIRIPELGLAQVAIRDVAVDGRWADRTLRLDEIRARIGAGHIEGRLDAGPIADAGASVTLELREVVLPGDWAKLGAGTAVADGRFRDGGLDLHRAEASWRGLATSLDGRIAGGSSLAARVKLSADLLEIGRAMRWEAVSGRASASAELSRRGQAMAVEGTAEIVDLVAAGHAVDPISASFRSTSSAGPGARWEATVNAPRIGWNHVTAENIAASLVVDARRLQVTGLRGRVAAIPAEGTGEWEWAGTGRGRVALGPVALRAIQGVERSFHIDGTGRATIDATIDRGVASATARADLDQVTVAGVSLGAGRSELRVRGRAVEGELSFSSRRLLATGAGRLESGGTLTGRVDLGDLALRPFLRELGSGAADHVDGRVSARADVTVPVDQPSSARGVVHLAADRLQLLGEPWTSHGPIVLRWEAPARVLVEHFRLDGPYGTLNASGALIGPADRGLSVALENARLPGALAELGRGTAQAAMRIRSGNFELTRLDAAWPRLTAAASGRASGDGSIELTGRVDADMAALAPAIGITGLSGRVVLAGNAHGRRDSIEVTGTVQASRIDVRGATVSDVELPFRFSRSTLRVERAHASLGASRVSADVTATWPRTAATTAALTSDVQVKAGISAPAARLEDVAALLPAALNGRGELAIAAHGEGRPRSWRGNASVTSPLIELAGGPMRQLRAELALDQTRLGVTDLRVDAFGIPARATGAWAWAGGGSAKATLGPAPLAALAMVPAGAGLEGTGRASIEAVVRSGSDVTGAAHAAFDDVAIGGVRLGRGQLDASAKDGVVLAELAFPGERLRATGRARVEDGSTLSGEVTVPAIDLGILARAFGTAPVALGGTLSARADVRVPLGEPRLGTGVLTIDPVRVVVASETWGSRSPIAARWAHGAVSLAPFQLAAKEALVTGEGTLAADGKLDARATAQLPLAMFKDMRPEIRELGGAAELTLRASGTLASPAFGGEGAIHRGSLLLRDRPETVRDLEARFVVSSQGVQLREATAAFSGGRVQARGDLALRGWQPGPYRIRLHADDVALGQVEGLSTAWNADLELAGLTGQAQLTGRARLVRGLYTRDLSIVSLVMSPGRAVAAETGTPVRLGVRVDLDDNLVVRTRAVNVRAGGVLDVEGTTSRPVVFGAIESRDGRIVFRGRDWSVSSAAVRFADPRRLDPFLDVLATTRINEYDVTMQVSGPVSNVNVRFSSTPRLSQNDLLSLVAFGTTGSGLKESPGTVLLGEAGKLLAQNVLGVNPAASGLRISTGSSGGTTASELHGFPGEERSIASRTAPGARKDTVRVEYQLWAPLYLSGEYDREGGYGTDVVLRFRFR